MRVALVGASEVSIKTAELLIRWGHGVIIVEGDAQRIEALSEQLDASFLNGDGSNPEVLKEVGPEDTDLLFCLTDSDQANIIASLIGRSLGFKRVVTSITDPAFTGICQELGLNDLIVPTQTISRYLADMVRGVDILELSAKIKGEARLFSFIAGKEDAGPASDLELPEDAKVICLYRGEEFTLANEDTTLKPDDEVLILTHSRRLADLQERWPPQQAV